MKSDAEIVIMGIFSIITIIILIAWVLSPDPEWPEL